MSDRGATDGASKGAADGAVTVWDGVTASVRGASHDRSGKPNQDAVRCVATENGGVVAAVCDGHGGNRYVRSDVGSRLGVEVASELGVEIVGHLGAERSATRIEAALSESTKLLIAYWRNSVMGHFRSHPFSEEEYSTGGEHLDSTPLVAYGCTLLMGVFGPNWVGFLQIGDGDVTVVTNGKVQAPVPGDERLVANQTTSLCLSSAAEDARVVALVEEIPELVMLSTDGYANSFASPDWQRSAGIDMADQVRKRGIEDVERRLPGWLEESARASGDDVTMALIRRIDKTADVGSASGVATVSGVVSADHSAHDERTDVP